MGHRKIPFYSLVLLIVAAIDSIRNLPSSALFGSALIFFFIFAAVIFLIPVSLVSAELAATFPEKGGVYHWIRQAFGEKWAMLAIWLQWINTMVWYPTILAFIGGTAAYLIDPALSQSRGFLAFFSIGVFWTITLVNLRGIHFSTRVNNVCAMVGTVIPLLFLIGLGCFWFFHGNLLQITLNTASIFPSLKDTNNWLSLIAIMASFLGMELSGVHVNDIHHPQRNFPRAVFCSAGFILVTMILGSLAIAFVIPSQEINLVAGVMQVFSRFFEEFGLSGLTPVLAVCIVLGTMGGIINWLISPAKGLLHAAEFGFLPPLFRKKNANGVATSILLAQAILVSLLSLLFFYVPSVNGFYWFLTALSTELYMIMYIMVFCAALFLHHSYRNRPKVFKIPGKNLGMWFVCLLGLFGATLTISVSFFPPDNVDVGSSLRYILMIASGNVLTISPVLLFYFYKKARS